MLNLLGVKSYDSTTILTPSSSFISPAYQESLSSTALIKPVTPSHGAFIPSTPIVKSPTMISTTAYVPTSSIYKPQYHSYPTIYETGKPSREPHAPTEKNSWNTVAVILASVVALVAVAVFIKFCVHLRKTCRKIKGDQRADSNDNIGGDGIALQDIIPNNGEEGLPEVVVVGGEISRPIQATTSSEKIGG